jgi:excisionase family DNA binding protein
MKRKPTVLAATPQAAPTAEPLLVRVEEAAHLLSLSKSMVYVLINRGELRATPPGGPRRVLRTSIDEWVARMTGNE